MADLKELDAAIAELQGEETTLAATVKKVDDDLGAALAKIASGASPADVTAELESIKQVTAGLAGVVSDAAAADAAANPPAPAT